MLKANLCKILNTDKDHLIQKVHSFNKNKIKYPCYIQEKIDGVYCIAYLMDNVVCIFSSTGREYLSMEHLKPELLDLMVKTETVFCIFETYIPNTSQEIISGHCRDEKKQHTELIGMVHDLLTMNEYLGLDNTSYVNRLGRVDVELTSYKYLKIPYTRVAFNFEFIEQTYNSIIQDGGEGLVIKNPRAPYSKGKRNYDLIKKKRVETYDCEVIDIVEGDGKYDGMVGALLCVYKGKQFTVGSGLNDEQRKEWYENPKLIIGHIAEIKAMKVTKNGVLREPVFVSVRYDKE